MYIQNKKGPNIDTIKVSAFPMGLFTESQVFKLLNVNMNMNSMHIIIYNSITCLMINIGFHLKMIQKYGLVF